MNDMKKLFLSALVFFATSSAMAADLRPVYRRSHAAPVPVYNWTGFYIGGNFGYSTGERTSSNAHLFNAAGVEQMQTFFSLAPSGWLGGVQTGFNWQLASNWVLGVEGDWNWTNQNDSACGVAGTACVNGPSPDGAASLNERQRWIATARARAGWAQDRWLLYMTGGGAWTSVDTTLLVNCPTGCGNLSGAAFGTGAFTDGKSGWTVGGGIEVMLTGNLTAKVEYLHLDFGTISHAVIAGPTVQTVALNNRLREDLVRFGLNYKFDSAAAPAIYK